jgi:hypothetical protein
MNPRHLLLLLTAGASAAAAHAQDLRSCRGLPDGAARLACYDALPLPADAAAPPARPAVAAAAAASGTRTVAAAPAPGAAQAVSGEAAFGLQGAARGEVEAVRSSVAGRFQGWGPRTRIRLANGQVWEVSDDSTAATWLQNPLVVVRRAALGSFLLEVEGLNRTARVRRVE